MNLFYIVKKVLVRLGSNKVKVKYARKAGVKIGADCTILGDVEWGSEPYLIEIGDKVRITAGCQFITHDGGMHVLRNACNMPKADMFGKIKVGNNVFIGICSIIMPGVTIGDNVVIGAGSIVTKDISSNMVACGVPARPIRTLEEYCEKSKRLIVPTKGMSAETKREYLLNMFGKDIDLEK